MARKRNLSIILALLMTLGIIASAMAAETDERAALLALADAAAAPTGQVIWGSSTDVNQYMWAGVWQNSAANADLSYLIGLRGMGGYSTVAWTKEGFYQINSIVTKSLTTTDNEDGSKTFVWEIADDLVWNDGTLITAKDYVFGSLLGISPQLAELDGDNSGGEVYAGGLAFSKGETNVFAGLRLLGEYTFSLTIAAEELPNHYELANAGVAPLPMHILAPGADVKDDGEGAYFSDEITTDLLRETILNEQTGYAFFPYVTAGAYNFVSFDTSTKTAILSANPSFVAMYDGAKPQIEKIIMSYFPISTQLDSLATGALDILPQMTDGNIISGGLDLVDAGTHGYLEYYRKGFGHITFKCDYGPTQFIEVRHALGWLLDRNEFAMSFTGGYGMVVDAAYGASMGEYKNNAEELEEKLIHYTYNPDKAIEELVAGGWTLDESGAEYVSGIRYKKLDDGTLMPLIIDWMASEANPVSDLITTMLLPEAEKAGFQINKTEVDFTTLLTNYYRDGVPDSIYNMFNLASNFSESQAYWYDYSSDPEYADVWNSPNIIDEELEGYAKQMKNIPADDQAAWEELWVKLMIRWNELLPQIPLYSNIYHDFYSAKIQGYDTNPDWNWSRAIVRCTVAE